MKKIFIGVGYWRNESLPHLPDPLKFVGEYSSINEKEKISDYLRKGIEASIGFGSSYCRFNCSRGSDLGSLELTDGVYIWPEGLVHYVEEHDVVLPKFFLDHICKRPKNCFTKIGDYDKENYDFKLWISSTQTPLT